MPLLRTATGTLLLLVTISSLRLHLRATRCAAASAIHRHRSASASARTLVFRRGDGILAWTVPHRHPRGDRGHSGHLVSRHRDAPTGPTRRPRIWLDPVAAAQPAAPAVAIPGGRGAGGGGRKSSEQAAVASPIPTPDTRHPTPAVDSRPPFERRHAGQWWIYLLYDLLLGVVALICVYTFRHYCFTLSRLVGTQRHPYIDVDTAEWPTVTVLVAAHNEEAVIAHVLEALLEADYPPEKLQIVPVNDRSTDRTRQIIDGFVHRFPGRITPFHRTKGKPGKAAALKDATARTSSEIILVFDADYVPGKGLVKQLVTAFFDPEVGAVMGRVVPWNVSGNLLTRLLDLERSGGYQVDQQARMNLNMVPQYGGTVGGVRRRALESVGGWRDDCLAEDTDLTYRLLLSGWKTAYQNRSECYEEVPETWPVRVRQIMRWARGHNQALARYGLALLLSRRVRLRERVDGLLLLGVYMVPLLLLLGWVLTVTLFYMGAYPIHGVLAILAVVCYSGLGNFAAFFEIAAATRLDGYRGRIRLLPFNLLSFLVSLVAVSVATLQPLFRRRGAGLVWHKTQRFRKDRLP